MFSVRQENWKEMAYRTLRGIGQRVGYLRRYSASRRHPHQTVTWFVDAEDDHPVIVPRTAGNISRHVAQSLDHAAEDVDFLQLAACIESDVPAVRRPKRNVPDSTPDGFGAGERPRFY